MTGLIIQFVVSLIAGVVVGATLYKLRPLRKFAVAGTVLSALVVLLITFWIVNRPAPALDLKITSPSNNDETGIRVLVQGTAPPDADVYVLVHPLLTDIWWVQNKPLVQNDGRWQTVAYVGNEQVGIGESYEVLAIATNEAKIEKLLRGTNLASGQQLKVIPPAFAKSNSVVIKRKQ